MERLIDAYFYRCLNYKPDHSTLRKHFANNDEIDVLEAAVTKQDLWIQWYLNPIRVMFGEPTVEKLMEARSEEEFRDWYYLRLEMLVFMVPDSLGRDRAYLKILNKQILPVVREFYISNRGFGGLLSEQDILMLH